MIAVGILEETRFGWVLYGYGIWITKTVCALSYKITFIIWFLRGMGGRRWWSDRRIHMSHHDCNAFILATGRADGADAGNNSFLTDDDLMLRPRRRESG